MLLQNFGDYYFQCPHSHRLRDNDCMWCEPCVRKIIANVCGLDINFLEISYRTPNVVALLQSLPVHLGPDACWPIPDATNPNKRLTLPYPYSFWGDERDFDRKKPTSRKYNYRRALYFLFWGDVGEARITRNTPPHGPCTDPNCCNPLHMVSVFNVMPQPRDFAYLNLEVDYDKLWMFQEFVRRGVPMENFWQTLAKPRIRDPKMDADVLKERTYCTHAEARKTVEVQPESSPEGEVAG